MSRLKSMVKHPSISLIDSSTTLFELKQIHAHLLINSLFSDHQISGQFIANIAIRNPTNLDYSERILNHSETTPTLFALNSMIRAHSKSSNPLKSFHLYNQIVQSSDHSVSPDNFTFSFMVRACAQASSSARELGPSVHCAAMKRGHGNDLHVQSGLVSMYAETGCLDSCRRVYGEILSPDLVSMTAMVSAGEKCGDVVFARRVFDEMPARDHVAWNAMIGGYVHGGDPREGLRLFYLMRSEGVRVNEVTAVLALSACSRLGALDHGRWIHGYIDENRIRMTVSLGTALVDMYGKCGDVTKSMEVFWAMRERNEFAWGVAMGGLAMNGRGSECLELFERMLRDGFRPNVVTFVAVLRGCSVVGMVEKGREHFRSMKEIYGIEPEIEHYGCLVDLYGRAGRLDEAMSVINEMPMKPHAGAWGALLNACRIYKNLEMGKLCSKKIVELEAENHGAYVQLSNMYADSKSWENVGKVREAMKSRGVRKIPGCSVLEIDGEVHEFLVGDKSHPRYGEIEIMMGEISRRLKLNGYMANTNPVLFDIEEEEKEDALCKHSEKIAIAFGLIVLREGIPIRIVKNLRVCWDCHEVTKMISKIFDREIVVRDRNRFHHFKDGECSCKGYW